MCGFVQIGTFFVLIGFLTLCMVTSQMHLSYAALCLKDVLICKCNSQLIATVLKESIGGRNLLCQVV